jgi:transcriptional regulator GlxA family with amidase domain
MDPQLKPEPLWDVLFMSLPDSLILDWAGPAEALRIGNQAMVQQGKPAPFRLRFVSPVAETVSSVGVTIAGLEPLPPALAGPSWIVLLGQPGQCFEVDSRTTQTALRWLETLKLKIGELELLTICGGSVLAAHAGLLNGRRATTHHQHLEELQRVAPTCQVVSNRVFVEDVPVFSSAGVTTGVDLILQRISHACAQDWDLAAMSSIAHTSPRHLTQAAEMAGFSSDTQLRRTWRQFGPPGTPSQTGAQGNKQTR